MKRKRRPHPKNNMSYLVAGGTMLALVGVLVDVKGMFKPTVANDVCQQVVQSQSVLSRDELSKLLTVPDRNSKESVRAIASEPYCLLPSVKIQAGAEATREVYPLAFDPQTWFVVLYEGSEYAGYTFVFKQQ